MKKIAVFAVMVIAGLALSGPIHSWSSGEYITSTDINAALTHLHANVGHGHGPIIVNADVSGTAAIAHSKLATPALLPKAWVSITTVCTAGTCAVADSSGITSTVWTATGTYTITFPTRGDANFGTLITATTAGGISSCARTAQTATTASIYCVDGANPHAAVNAGFTFLLLDSGT